MIFALRIPTLLHLLTHTTTPTVGFFPFFFFSESSEEESAGEREEETGAHDATGSTKTTEVPAGQSSNTPAGECRASSRASGVHQGGAGRITISSMQTYNQTTSVSFLGASVQKGRDLAFYPISVLAVNADVIFFSPS